MINIVR